MTSKTHSDANRSDSISRHIRGQGLTEYIIIVALVAVAAIWAASFFGDTVKANFVALGSELTGAAQYDAEAETNGALQRAQTTVTTETDLGNYSD